MENVDGDCGKCCKDDEKWKKEKGIDIEKFDSDPADFEKAIGYTGYGGYNKWMLVYLIPSTMTTLFCTTSASFILPVADCYFGLKDWQKGLLLGAVYVGMVLSAFVWGFLIDTLGRQKLLFYGLLLSGFMEFFAGLSFNYWMLVVFKFLSGVSTCGPYSLAFTFGSEFYDKEHREKMIFYAGGFTTFGYVLQPLMAYFLIPMDVNYEFFDGHLVINKNENWRLFLIAGALFIFLAAFLIYFTDESPNFLMAVGRNEEALRVLRKMYSRNTGKPPESYPVCILKSGTVDEQSLRSSPSTSVAEFVKNGWTQIRPLFMKPYLTPSSLTFFLQFTTMLTLNTFRLRLPQMYAKIVASGDMFTAVCGTNDVVTSSSHCQEIKSKIYVNSLLIGLTVCIVFWVAVYAEKYMTKNKLFIILTTLSGLGIAAFPWTTGLVTLVFAAVYVALMNINVTVVTTIARLAVPTTLGGMTVNMVVMFGRIGVISGNLIEPTLHAISCELPYSMFAILHFLSLIVIAILIRRRI